MLIMIHDIFKFSKNRFYTNYNMVEKMSNITQKTASKTKKKRNFECLLTKKDVVGFDKFEQKRFHDLTNEQRTDLIIYWNKRLSHLEKQYVICVQSHKGKDYSPIILLNYNLHEILNKFCSYVTKYLIMNKYSHNLSKGITSFWNTDNYVDSFRAYFNRYNNLWYVKDFDDHKININEELKNIKTLKSQMKKICLLNDFIHLYKNYCNTDISESNLYENIEKHENLEKIINAQFSTSIILKDLNQYESLKFIIYKILKQNDCNIQDYKIIDRLISRDLHDLLK
jgi:hypothetical protein